MRAPPRSPRAAAGPIPIPVELAGVTRFVASSDVRYVEAQGDYARLHTAEGSHLVRIPLSVLEEKWADAGFVRIHRSYLVSLPLVTELRLGIALSVVGAPFFLWLLLRMRRGLA